MSAPREISAPLLVPVHDGMTGPWALAERFRCTQQVGLLKAELDLPPSDPGREERQVVRLRALAQDSGLDPVFAEKFFTFIVAEVIRHHEAIRDELAE